MRTDRALYVYKSKRGGQADLKLRIKQIAETRVGYGYRLIHLLLKREGWDVNPKRVYRLYKKIGLQLRNKTRKRRVKAKLREGRTTALNHKETWAMYFVHDQLANGRKSRVLTMVDTFPRFSPAVDARFSYRGEDMVQTLEKVCARVGYPRVIRVNQGSEFISRNDDLNNALPRPSYGGHLHQTLSDAIQPESTILMCYADTLLLLQIFGKRQRTGITTSEPTISPRF